MMLRLPYPPSVNHYWFRNRSGGLRIGPRGVSYRLEVLTLVRRQKLPKMAGKLAVEIIACPPDRRRRDLDNLLKATLDALQHAGLYADDNAINRLTICRGVMVTGGMLAVTVERI